MHFSTIIIANIAEAFEGSINKMRSLEKRRARIGIEHGLCDRTLLWGGDNKVVVTPFPISPEIFKKNSGVFSFKNVINLSPRRSGVSLSEAILKDKNLLEDLTEVIRNNPGIEVSPYCITEKFLSLVNFLAQKNLRFSVKQKPVYGNSHWLVSYLDSKVGSRMEIGGIRHCSVRVPESMVCGTREEVMHTLMWFYDRKKSCVVKANFGESGWGLIMLPRGRFKSAGDVMRHVCEEFEKDSIWQDGLILVEEYIESDGSYGTSPSSELYVDEHGAKITYVCDQVLGTGGTFLGVALGKNVLSEKIKKQIRIASFQVGKKFWKMGYRGFFDIDFVVSKEGVPFVIETNMRRTGGTHTYDAVRRLTGKHWENTVFSISLDNFKYGEKRLAEKEILGKMKSILYPINGQENGVIVSIVDRKQPTFGFIIIEKSREEAIKMHSKILTYWGMKK